MSTYLYKYTPPDLPERNVAYVTTLTDLDVVYLLPKEDQQATLVGKWNNDGTLVYVDQTIYSEIRPLGNEEINIYDELGNIIDTKTGVSTDKLALMHYQGHAQRNLQNSATEGTLIEYPVDNQPFTLRITRTLTTDDAWPHIPWGWTVEMLSEDPSRDITARAIGIYDESDTYLYTTGAFVLTDFDELDIDENPIVVQRYATECPIGQRSASPDPVYFKLLLGAATEGSWTLSDIEEGATQVRLFWSGDQ